MNKPTWMPYRLLSSAALAGGLAGVLAGCGPTDQGGGAPRAAPAPTPSAAAAGPEHTQPAQSQRLDVQWRCGDNPIAGRLDLDTQSLNLTHERGELVLQQQISGSGARYADANGNQLWIKGQDATLTLSGQAERSCHQSLPQTGPN